VTPQKNNIITIGPKNKMEKRKKEEIIKKLREAQEVVKTLNKKISEIATTVRSIKVEKSDKK
jgi:uncharacterized protein YlxW (UPF0749 family)